MSNDNQDVKIKLNCPNPHNIDKTLFALAPTALNTVGADKIPSSFNASRTHPIQGLIESIPLVPTVVNCNTLLHKHQSLLDWICKMVSLHHNPMVLSLSGSLSSCG